MNAIPSLPKLPKKAKAPKKCACGCEQLTKGGKFMPGHDAKIYAWALRVERGIVKIDATGPHKAAVEALIKARKANPKAKVA